MGRFVTLKEPTGGWRVVCVEYEGTPRERHVTVARTSLALEADVMAEKLNRQRNNEESKQ